MLQNLILVLIALVVVLFMGLLWLRYSLFQSLQSAQQNRVLLQKDFDKRRDAVPYLLEGARQAEEPNDAWRKLVEEREAFNRPSKEPMPSLAVELQFEKLLSTYMQSSPARTVAFLDAKKDIEELNAIIEKQKIAFQEAIIQFNSLRKAFPYRLASGIFGFRELTP